MNFDKFNKIQRLADCQTIKAPLKHSAVSVVCPRCTAKNLLKQKEEEVRFFVKFDVEEDIICPSCRVKFTFVEKEKTVEEPCNCDCCTGYCDCYDNEWDCECGNCDGKEVYCSVSLKMKGGKYD